MEVGKIGCGIEFADVDVYLVDGMGSVDEERNAFFLEELLECIHGHDNRRD